MSILHGVKVASDLCLGVNVSRCYGATVYQELSFDNSKLQLLITVGSRTIIVIINVIIIVIVIVIITDES